MKLIGPSKFYIDVSTMILWNDITAHNKKFSVVCTPSKKLETGNTYNKTYIGKVLRAATYLLVG
mgnify:CR=1 FL=1